MTDDKTTWEAHPLALKASVFAEAPEIERITLKFVAATIELERDRLRPVLGKVDLRQVRGFIPASKAVVDVVDTMSWEDLLQHPGVIERCRPDAEIKESEILHVVLKYGQPSNRRALSWMRSFYSLAEKMHVDQLSIARQLVKEHKAYLDKQKTRKPTDANIQKGEDVRVRVLELAAPMVGRYSREKAAGLIATKVDRGVPHIKNILREAYPGGYATWPKPSAPTGHD